MEGVGSNPKEEPWEGGGCHSCRGEESRGEAKGRGEESRKEAKDRGEERRAARDYCSAGSPHKLRSLLGGNPEEDTENERLHFPSRSLIHFSSDPVDFPNKDSILTLEVCFCRSEFRGARSEKLPIHREGRLRSAEAGGKTEKKKEEEKGGGGEEAAKGDETAGEKKEKKEGEEGKNASGEGGGEGGAVEEVEETKVVETNKNEFQHWTDDAGYHSRYTMEHAYAPGLQRRESECLLRDVEYTV
ncbi:hypothetical protein ACLOJK_019263 [Asimina triloba]